MAKKKHLLRKRIQSFWKRKVFSFSKTVSAWIKDKHLERQYKKAIKKLRKASLQQGSQKIRTTFEIETQKLNGESILYQSEALIVFKRARQITSTKYLACFNSFFLFLFFYPSSTRLKFNWQHFSPTVTLLTAGGRLVKVSAVCLAGPGSCPKSVS